MMMKYVTAVIIKFVMVTFVLWVILGGLYNVSFGDILTISILLTGVGFLVGDLFILPRVNNTVATLADFGLTLLGVWVLGALLFERPIPLGTAAFLSAVVFMVGEFFFHMYLQKQGLTKGLQNGQKGSANNTANTSSKTVSTYKYQTEAGSDMAVRPVTKNANTNDRQSSAAQPNKKKNFTVDQYQTEAGSDITVKPVTKNANTNDQQRLAGQLSRQNTISVVDPYQTEAAADIAVKSAIQDLIEGEQNSDADSNKKKNVSVDRYQTEAGSEIFIKPAGNEVKEKQKNMTFKRK